MEKESDPMLRAPVLGHLTYREWHAFVNGFYIGFVRLRPREHEYKKEKHYWRAGFIAGWTTKMCLLAVLLPHFTTAI
jgi:hypothetical protein